MKNKIISEIHEIVPYIINLRHELHKIPEIKFEEIKTARLIRKELSKCGIKMFSPLLGTDIVALIQGNKPGKTVALRADMDALPIEDTSGNEWHSLHLGMSHSCGHDGHMAILLGIARVLSNFRSELSGNILFIFQPAEEEVGGGKLMIEKGLLERKPKPEIIFALHGWPGLPVGSFTTCVGTLMAGADTFSVIVKGEGGHVGKPHKAIDTVLVCAKIIIGLKEISACFLNPINQSIVSVCSIKAGTQSNIIPEKAELRGAIRYFNINDRELIHKKMLETIRYSCELFGAKFEFEIQEGYIPLINDKKIVSFSSKIIKKYLGKQFWSDSAEKTMVSEDFAYYLNAIPGAFFQLGLGLESKDLHTADFDFNDRALENGIIGMAALAFESQLA